MVEGADLPLFGRGALVTGAGRGIGRAIAQRLAALGATVLCVSRTQSELDETVRSAGSRAFALALDISADGAAQAMVDALLARVPSLDILVHCAGIMQTGSVEGMDLVDFDRAFKINVRSPYALTQAALPALKVGRGQVLFVNSSIIRAANTAGRGMHAVAQAALMAFADSLRDEVKRSVDRAGKDRHASPGAAVRRCWTALSAGVASAAGGCLRIGVQCPLVVAHR